MPSLGLLARNTLWMTFGQGVRILVQVVYFVLIARILHRDGYGAFSGVVALVGILVPFAGWGSGNLLIKNVARDTRVFAVYWSRTLIQVSVSAVALTMLVLLLAWWILPASVSLHLVLWVAISDLFFARLIEAGGQAFQAFHYLFKTALLNVLVSLARVAAVLVLVTVRPADALGTWSVLYLGSTATVALLACLWVSLEFGWPRGGLRGSKGEFSEGFYFAASVSAQRIYMDSNKTLLTRLSTLDAAGIYSAASRIVDVATVPLFALTMSAYPRYFVHGRDGVRGSLVLTRRLLPWALGYAVFIGLCMYTLAPAIPWLLGGDFGEATAAVRWLAPLTFIITWHRFAADSLTGAGYQRLRALCEFLAAVFNIVANLALIPAFSWHAAAAVTLGTEGLLAVTLWLVVWRCARAERRASTVSSPP